MQWLIEPFQPITLDQLNRKAAMLERLDNKYIIHQNVLIQAIPELAKHFDILEIDDKRWFTYLTCYVDTADYSSYYDHHQGRRQRCKIRIRKYLDAQLCFLEVKLKDKRGITMKKRMKYASHNLQAITKEAYTFINEVYSDLYGRAFHSLLFPVLEMNYKRVTLVAKEGGERMTLDSHLTFYNSNHARVYPVDEHLFIVETKSEKGNGIADKILRHLHQHPTPRCSKYCLGMVAIDGVHKHNKFMPALRKLNIVREL